MNNNLFIDKIVLLYFAIKSIEVAAVVTGCKVLEYSTSVTHRALHDHDEQVETWYDVFFWALKLQPLSLTVAM